MKRFISLNISLLVFLLGAAGFLSPLKGASLEKGHLRLGPEPFKEEKIISLDGQWEFYWKKLLTPQDFSREKKPRPTHYLRLPGPWSKQAPGKKALPAKGYGTFRAVIDFDDKSLTPGDTCRIIAIDMPFVHTAYHLWINGRLILKNGRVAQTKEKMVPCQVPRLGHFTPKNNRAEIILQISNFQQRFGGISKTIRIGPHRKLQKKKDLRYLIVQTVAGCILVIAIFHFSLFFYRRKNDSNIIFAFFSLVIVIRLLLTSEKILSRFLPQVPWEITFRLEYMTIPGSVILFTLFIFSRHRDYMSSLAVRAIVGYHSILIIYALFSPVFLLSRSLDFYNAGLFIAIVYVAWSVIRFSTRERKWPLLHITGISAIFLAIVHDILFSHDYLKSVYIFPAGLLVFIITQSIMALQQSLDEQSRLQTINRELEIAGSLQRSILPAEIPLMKGLDIHVRYVPMRQIGGDLYHFHHFDEKTIGIIVADVTGHGIPASLIASMVKIAFSQQIELAREPAHLLAGMNNMLFKQIGGQFVTASYLYIDGAAKKLKAARAGHPPPLMIRNGTVQEIISRGRLLGTFSDINCTEAEIDLATGDILLLYTDGITESRRGEKYLGSNGLMEILSQTDLHNAPAVADTVITAAENWSDSDEAGDDITLVVVEVS